MTPETKEHPTMEAGRELDAGVALKVMGYTCVHEAEPVPIEVVADSYAREWEEEYGQPCPREKAKSEAEWQQWETDHPRRWCRKCHHERVHGIPDTGIWRLPAYSTDIAAAWRVFEKLEANGWRWTLVMDDCGVGAMVERGDPNDPRPGCYACHEVGLLSLEREEFIGSSTLTIPHAICLVALKAVGEEV